MVQWPESLPQRPVRDGFSATPQSGVVETEMDAGLPKVRRRFTATYTDYSLTYIMTYAQFEIFEQFYNNSPTHETLPGVQGGVWRFYIPNPYSESADDLEVRFVAQNPPYRAMPDGDSTEWAVSFRVRRLP